MKKKIGLLFGGPGVENEISIISAKSIFEHIDRSLYEVLPIFMNFESDFLLIKANNNDNKNDFFQKLKSSSDYNLLESDFQKVYFTKNGIWLDNENEFEMLDCVFNIIHGYPGETGEIQGFLDVLKIPFIGSDSKSSCVLMDKEFTNIIALSHGVNVLKFEVAYKDDIKDFDFYKEKLEGLPFFIKASNAGSSKGVYKIKTKEEFDDAIKEVFSFDKKIIIQKGLEFPDEIELAAFVSRKNSNNIQLKVANSIGMIKPSKKHGFYSYEAKYFDEKGAELIINPKDLSDENKEKLKNLTKKLFKIFDCSMGRIDFLLDKKTNKIYFNEINTLPGFTSISMFPKLFIDSGLEYKNILSELIDNCL